MRVIFAIFLTATALSVTAWTADTSGGAGAQATASAPITAEKVAS